MAFKKHRSKPALPHDDRLHHFLLLDCFVLLQRNRKRSAFDRSSALAAKCKTPSASSGSAQSVIKTPRTPDGNRFAYHKCRRHTRPSLADAAVGPFVWVCRVLYRTGNCGSHISPSPCSPPEVALPAISVPRSPSSCLRAGIRLDPLVTCARH